MEAYNLQNIVKLLILSIKAHPDYVRGEDSDEWHDLISSAEMLIEKDEKIKQFCENIIEKYNINGPSIEYKLGMTVYHKDIYNGHEPLKIVGIREHELELRGDYSGMYNIIDDCWLPIEGVLLNKPK